MTKEQEIFNKAYLGLERQGFRRSVVANNACQYLTEDGRRCAIGWCLTNPPANCSLAVHELMRTDRQAAQDLQDAHVAFLEDLQRAHDSSPSPEQMQEMFKSLAIAYGLTIPEKGYAV